MPRSPASLPLRVVLDTATVVSAVRSRHGAANALLDLVLEGQALLLMDYKIGSEYREVILRPEHVSASHLSHHQIVDLLVQMERLSQAVEIRFRHRPLSNDPDDDRILDLAINGQADAIVTANMRHFVGPAALFGIQVVDARTMLFRIRKRGDHGSSE